MWYDLTKCGAHSAHEFTGLDWGIHSLLRTAEEIHREIPVFGKAGGPCVENAMGFRVIGRQGLPISGEIIRCDHEGKPDDCWLVYLKTNTLTGHFVLQTERGYTLASARKRFSSLIAAAPPGMIYSDALVVRPEWAYATLPADDPDKVAFEARIREIDERIAANRAAYNAQKAAETEEREKDELLVLLERYGHPDTWKKEQ